jgi:hypothetical protein
VTWARVAPWIRGSAVPYLALLMTALMVAAWVNYLADRGDPADFLLKGQAPGIFVPILAFPAVSIVWLLYRAARARDNWITAFLAILLLAWPVHVVIALSHGDQLAHTVWIYVPLLLMILIKPPSPVDALAVVVWFAWLACGILVVTRVLEVVGLIPVFALDPEIIEWERDQYWMPLNDLLGFEGRWPGPFGFNSKTGFIGALLVIISLARWRPRNAILLLIGVVTLLVTASRGSFLAAACGIAVLATFTRWGWLGRIPLLVRVLAAGAAALGVALWVLWSPTGLTGRNSWIWPAFFDLWQTSPWIGVGQVGILADPEASVPMEAHNLYLQELTRFGIVGLVVQYLPLLLGLGLALVAAWRGRAWPLAVLVSFGVASITEVFMDGWLMVSAYVLLLVLAVAATRGPDAGAAPPSALSSKRADDVAIGP